MLSSMTPIVEAVKKIPSWGKKEVEETTLKLKLIKKISVNKKLSAQQAIVSVAVENLQVGSSK